MKRKLIILMGVLFTFGVLSAQTPETDWRESVKTIKTLIKTNPQEAAVQAGNLIKGKNKKNIELIVAIGDAYLDAKNLQEANRYLAIAQQVNRKSPLASVLEGDIALENNDPGTACQKYEQAIYFDKNCFDAYVKYANVYRGANPEESINKLEQLKAVNPKQAPDVDKAEAKIYYTHNQFDKAAEAYSKFIDTPAATEDDMARYAFTLFLSHKFDESLAIAQKGLQKNSRSAVFNRLLMYNNADLKHFDEAEKAGEAFFNSSDSASYSYLDYKYYGYVLTALKKYDKAIPMYQKALEKDTTQTALWQEISNAYEEMEDYHNAIPAFNNYFKTLKGEEKTPELIFSLGKLYYGAGTNLDEKTQATLRKSYLMSADSTFAIVAELRPDSYMGNLWRARTNSNLDPEVTQGLAKPYYEKAAELLVAKNNPKYNDYIIECYKYLGYYYVVKKQYAASKDYWNKILAIDPTNEVAKKALSGMK